MAGVKGRSGTNRNQDKPFIEALRMEITAAGPDHKALRAIAGKVIAKALKGDEWAITTIADRLDGKPTQDNSHTLSGEVRVVLRKMLEDEDDENKNE